MVEQVQLSLLQSLVIQLCFGRQGEKTHDDFLILGLAFLFQQGLGMVGIFDILVAIRDPTMPGNQFMIVVEADSVGVGLHRQLGPGILSRYRVAVGVDIHPELLARPDLGECAGIIGMLRQPQQTGWPLPGTCRWAFSWFRHGCGHSPPHPTTALPPD